MADEVRWKDKDDIATLAATDRLPVTDDVGVSNIDKHTTPAEIFTYVMSGVSTTERDILDGATVSTAELNILDGVTSTAAELNLLDGVTSTTAELNILDGVTADKDELNILDGVTVTTAEINLLDGVTGEIATTVATQTLTNKTLVMGANEISGSNFDIIGGSIS